MTFQQPCGQSVAEEAAGWDGEARQGSGWPQLQEWWAPAQPQSWCSVLAAVSVGGGSVPWCWERIAFLLGLDCLSGESHCPGASGDLLEGGNSLEERGEQPVT